MTYKEDANLNAINHRKISFTLFLAKDYFSFKKMLGDTTPIMLNRLHSLPLSEFGLDRSAYISALPQKNESFISCLKRNEFASYPDLSLEQHVERKKEWFSNSLYLYAKNIPVVNKLVSDKEVSAELFLNQSQLDTPLVGINSAEGSNLPQGLSQLQYAVPLSVDIGFKDTTYFLRLNSFTFRAWERADSVFCDLEDYFSDAGYVISTNDSNANNIDSYVYKK
jgi:hypothetical protein